MRARISLALALGAAATAMASAAPEPAGAAGAPGLTVVPVSATATGLSYFKLQAQPGRTAGAGSLELRNPTGRALRVVLAPVAGQTIDTLGSTYAPVHAHARAQGPVAWVRLSERRVTVPARGHVSLPVQVAVPAAAKPGDYLAGVSVEALGQQRGQHVQRGVSIASVVRYAIGVEVSVPGPRRPLIRFTGARLQRQPSGLAFLLDARNPGNVILQNVHGRALVTRGSRRVAAIALGPGTFVTGTRIAYPVVARGETATPGTVYRVRAYLKYAGGIARLDTLVRFGAAAASVQKAFEKPAHSSSGFPGWLGGLLGALGLGGLLLLLARRRRRGSGAPLPALEAALARARETGQPLALIVVAPHAALATRTLGRTIRERLRHSDSLHELGERSFLVIAEGTDAVTARVLGEDVRRHVERVSAAGVAVAVHEADPSLGADELLRRASAPVVAGLVNHG